MGLGDDAMIWIAGLGLRRPGKEGKNGAGGLESLTTYEVCEVKFEGEDRQGLKNPSCA
jgi:hypothetical protein